MRLETELIRFEQDAGGVIASLRERGGREYTMRAAYMVAADGHRSPIREALGIGRAGRGHIQTVRSVLFRAPLEEYRRTGVTQFAIDQPGFEAFLTTYGDGRWVLIFWDDEERDTETLRALAGGSAGRAHRCPRPGLVRRAHRLSPGHDPREARSRIAPMGSARQLAGAAAGW